MRQEKQALDYERVLIPELNDGKTIRIVKDLLNYIQSMELTDPPVPPPPPPPNQRPKPDGSGNPILKKVSAIIDKSENDLTKPKIKSMIMELFDYAKQLELQQKK